MFNRIRELLQTEKKSRGRQTQHQQNHLPSSSICQAPPPPVFVKEPSPTRTVRSDESDYEGGSSRRNLTPTRCPISYTKIKALGRSMNIRTSQLIDISATASIHNIHRYVENAHRHPEITFVILKYDNKQTDAVLRILLDPTIRRRAYGCFITSKGNFAIEKENLELTEIRIDSDRRSL